MKALGAKAYRFSIAWPRVFPEGAGSPNPKGLDFYHRLLDELSANGIEPFATLYHWDLPQALQDRFGGWTSRDTSKAFADYAAYVAARLGDRVKHFFTINECSRLVASRPRDRRRCPGLKLSPAELKQVRHNVALGHGLAVQAIRAHGRAGTRVGPAENAVSCIPAIETPANIRAAEIATRELNAGYLTVMLEGKYTDAYLAQAGKDAPKYTAEDLRIISSPIDFVGLNVYMPDHYVVAADNERGFTLAPFPASFPHMKATWLRPGPETMYWVPRHVAKLWNVKSIYITENGTSGSDQPAADGTIYDVDRIMYLRNYLTQLQRATSEGVPVRGYFLWSLMDNFEWSDGYEQRFGLYHVDFDDTAPHAQAERIVLSRDDRAKRRGVIGRLSIRGAQALAQRLEHHRLQRQLDPPALRRRLHHEDNEHVVLRDRRKRTCRRRRPSGIRRAAMSCSAAVRCARQSRDRSRWSGPGNRRDREGFRSPARSDPTSSARPSRA